MNQRTLTVEKIDIDQIDVEEGRFVLEDKKVDELVDSIKDIGLRLPIWVRKPPVGPCYLVVSGASRLAAAKKLGWEKIDCIVAEPNDPNVELWEIDENLVRAKPGAAEHALLTLRRAKIVEARAASEVNSSQRGTKSNTAKNPKGAGRKKAAASIRDQAAKTGESKSKVARSKKRAEKLGEETLQKVIGTSLATGVEVDALADMTPEEQAPLIAKAHAGENVTARGKSGKPSKAIKGKRGGPVPQSDVALAHCPNCSAPPNWRELTEAKRLPGPRGQMSCSFCAKPKEAVKVLFAGSSCFICNECVMQAFDICRAKEKELLDERATAATIEPVEPTMGEPVVEPMQSEAVQ